MQAEHVPAWKKIGLKLKFAQETNIERIPAPSLSNVDRQNENINGFDADDVEARPAKKRRLSDPPHVTGSSPRILTSSFRGPDTTLKKKVSFTAETKDIDGDSSRSLLAAQEARNQYINDLYNEHSAQIQADTKARSDAKAMEMGRTSSKARYDRPGKSKDALEYLNQFHEAKNNWKFNKNREIWILKHALSIEAIPESCDTALASYVGGLRSRGARTRLMKQCQVVLASESAESTMEHSERRLVHHEEAKVQHLEKSEENSNDQERILSSDTLNCVENRPQRTRAQLLLRSMGATSRVWDSKAFTNEDIVSHSSLSVPNATTGYSTNPTISANRKKRKNRTAVAEISNSDSGDSSDSNGNERQTRRADSSSTVTKNSRAGSHVFVNNGDDPISSDPSSSNSSNGGDVIKANRMGIEISVSSKGPYSRTPHSSRSSAYSGTSHWVEDRPHSETSSGGSSESG